MMTGDGDARPSKRPRLPSPPAPAPPRPSGPFLALHPPYSYINPAQPTPFQLPSHLTSFSYSPTRDLLLDERRDEAIATYVEPRIGVDLNQGFEECVWRDGSVDEGLDALLNTLQSWVTSAPSTSTSATTNPSLDVIQRASIITWRGMLTKLMLAVYELENKVQGRRADGWEMNAMIVDGVLYLEDANSPAKLSSKTASEQSYKIQSYYGYSFESFCTSRPSASSSSSTPPPPSSTDPFETPNTNVQWCSVVKTSLGPHRVILGGEVDCLHEDWEKRGRVDTKDFVELKTNIVIQSERDEVMFERQKLLKHYVQSFLLGVPTITVGFRTRAGILSALQTFQTLSIPRLVRGKPHAWDPLACLASGNALIDFIISSIRAHPASATRGDEMVFRVSFDPHRGGVGIRTLSQAEVDEEVLGAKKDLGEGGRTGFLKREWVEWKRGLTGRSANGGGQAPPPVSVRAPAPKMYEASKVAKGIQR
ncbi:RAI1-like domain containing protein [Pseudohyphozyma bogoriensis]|nr:RAI1-like domain containing protein [Pseudohyphozyma bogoriensis]